MATEKRLIDANALTEALPIVTEDRKITLYGAVADFMIMISAMPTVDAVEVKHGRWVLTAHEKHSNYRWYVTAECSECNHDKGEIYAGFFSGFPKDMARDVVLDNAKSVKLDNFCPNCGADMR